MMIGALFRTSEFTRSDCRDVLRRDAHQKSRRRRIKKGRRDAGLFHSRENDPDQ
jgi:hypothetical protein